MESHDAAPHARFDPRPSTRSVGAQASDGGVRQHGKVHRTIKTYDRRDGIYVLHEVRDEVDEISGGRATTQVSVMTLTNLTWHINKQKDAERERLLALALAAPASSSPASIGLVKPSGPSAVIVCDPSVDPSCGGGGSPPPPPPPTGPAQNIVFQHGILSNAGTWDRMDPWLSSTFFFGKKVKLSLPSLQHIDVQAGQLRDSMAAAAFQPAFLVVGHSQGGLIGRRVGQMNTFGLVSGVLTIGSPHLGTNLARNSKQVVSDVVGERIARVADGCASPFDDWGCYIADQLSRNILSTVVNYAVDQAIPASTDLTLHSYFIDAQLNSGYESFQRAGIQSYANKRWMLMRLLGDSRNYPESQYGGRNLARFTQWVFDGFRSCQIASVFFGDFTTSHNCGYIANRMEDFDGLWDRLTADGDDSDGVVQGSSQLYPNTGGAYVPQQYEIFGGDSHLGETNSDLTRNQINRAFVNQFNVSRY